jgi:pyridoxal phosphate enzyme (YggS family)
MSEPADFNERLQMIRSRIAAAAQRAQRDPAGIRLVAVSKGQPAGLIREAFDAGMRDFGENYLEEAEPKIRALDPSITWHMIGHVQSRKAKGVVDLFPFVHSVDSAPLANRLSRFAVERGRTVNILLECNLSGETTKFGWPADDPPDWELLLRQWEPILPLPGITAIGLMTMAPFSDDPEESRPVFRRLRLLRDAARARFPEHLGAQLSMGMSDDFEQAVEEGATLIRIGRALFGPRPAAVKGTNSSGPMI